MTNLWMRLKKYESKFTKVAVAEPLLGEVGKDASVINKDKETVAKAVVAEAVKTAKFDSIEAADRSYLLRRPRLIMRI